MKLKTFNQANLPKADRCSTKLYINSKTGLFHFNRSASEKLGLTSGDTVEFHQDEDEPSDWYISKSKSGFLIRNKAKGDDATSGTMFNNSALANLIFSTIDAPALMGSCLIGAEPQKEGNVEYWPIITASIKAK